MGSQLAEVIPLERPTTSSAELVKPCSWCATPAAFKVSMTTGIDAWGVEMRACVEHLALSIEHNAIEAEKYNHHGDHPALFPWLVTVARYQR